MGNESYSISELAQEFQITTRTIRFYEDKDLLHPTRNGSVRVFCRQDRTHLKLILRGKRLGFKLAEIKELIELYGKTPGDKGQLELFLERIKERSRLLKQQQADLEKTLKELVIFEQQTEALLLEM